MASQPDWSSAWTVGPGRPTGGIEWSRSIFSPVHKLEARPIPVDGADFHIDHACCETVTANHVPIHRRRQPRGLLRPGDPKRSDRVDRPRQCGQSSLQRPFVCEERQNQVGVTAQRCSKRHSNRERDEKPVEADRSVKDSHGVPGLDSQLLR